MSEIAVTKWVRLMFFSNTISSSLKVIDGRKFLSGRDRGQMRVRVCERLRARAFNRFTKYVGRQQCEYQVEQDVLLFFSDNESQLC